MRAATEAREKAVDSGDAPKPKEKSLDQMTLAEQLQHQQKIMREKAEAREKALKDGKGPAGKPAQPKELTFAE